MSTKEVQNIIDIMEKAIYPEVVKKESFGYVNERLEDMTCFFYMAVSPTEKVYLKQQMEEILKDGGYKVCTSAFQNYRRDLVVSIDKLLHRGIDGITEIALITGSYNMGAILFCNDLLEAVKKVYGSDYVIVAVLERGLILIKAEENISMPFLSRIHGEMRAEMKEEFLTECFFLYKESKLTKIEEM